MSQAIIPRRGGGSGYATITFNGVSDFKKTAVDYLSEGRQGLSAALIGNYVLFAGGENSSARLSTVDAYNTSLTRSTPTALSNIKTALAATEVGTYALFGGGENGSNYLSTVDAYNTSLTRSTPTSLSVERSHLAATAVGTYALFGGGYNRSSPYQQSTVDAYNTSLTRSTPTALSDARDYLAAATTANGSYALFGGGSNGGSSSIVDAYNSSLTRSTPTSLSVARYNLAATKVAGYVLFGGGMSGQLSKVVDAYNLSLVRYTPTVLSEARVGLAATTTLNARCALFGGGGTIINGVYTGVNTVDAYNNNLTRSTPTALSDARYNLAAATTANGSYALFGGGMNPNYLSTVDAYYLNNKVQVYPGTIYKLGSMSSESTSSTMQEIETTAPITGYIKIKDATIN